mmetsp:Transcript_61649/g.144359  ORF Transcript_61649/g.144359 Transcript_61649/m.144359 type:complete len:202 (+) Transcript_61649:1204-1809(+)
MQHMVDVHGADEDCRQALCASAGPVDLVESQLRADWNLLQLASVCVRRQAARVAFDQALDGDQCRGPSVEKLALVVDVELCLRHVATGPNERIGEVQLRAVPDEARTAGAFFSKQPHADTSGRRQGGRGPEVARTEVRDQLQPIRVPHSFDHGLLLVEEVTKLVVGSILRSDVELLSGFRCRECRDGGDKHCHDVNGVCTA